MCALEWMLCCVTQTSILDKAFVFADAWCIGCNGRMAAALSGNCLQLEADALSKPTPLLGVAYTLGNGNRIKASLLASV